MYEKKLMVPPVSMPLIEFEIRLSRFFSAEK